MSSKTNDAEFADLNRRFGGAWATVALSSDQAGLEDAAGKLLKDSSTFRESVSCASRHQRRTTDVPAMLTSSAAFSSAFQTVFGPIGSDYDLDRKFPGAMETVKAMSAYQVDMGELRDALVPELELIDSRILAPIKDYVDVLKRIRKAIVKRDHKLVDYDRHNNSCVAAARRELTAQLHQAARQEGEDAQRREEPLQSAQACVTAELTMQVEQDFEAATQDYEHHNNALKSELPRFFELSTAFITPLFQSFYFLQLQVRLSHLTLADGSGPLHDAREAAGLRREQVRPPRRRGRHVRVADWRCGGAARGAHDHQALRLDGSVLSLRTQLTSAAKMMAAHRQGSTDTTSSAGVPPARSSSGSISRPAPARAGSGGLGKPPIRSTPPSTAAAPPPYSAVGASSAATAAATVGKRAPPPPPAARPKPAAQYCTALYDFECQAEGDLSFNVGDRIEIVTKTASAQDWWTGKLDGRQGSFPGARASAWAVLIACRQLCATRLIDRMNSTVRLMLRVALRLARALRRLTLSGQRCGTELCVPRRPGAAASTR